MVDEINHAVCRFLAAACVADLPDVVAEVASLWPEAAAVRMPLSDLGPHFAEFSRTVILSDEVTRSEAITVTPAYVALQLSASPASTHCMLQRPSTCACSAGRAIQASPKISTSRVFKTRRHSSAPSRRLNMNCDVKCDG